MAVYDFQIVDGSGNSYPLKKEDINYVVMSSARVLSIYKRYDTNTHRIDFVDEPTCTAGLNELVMHMDQQLATYGSSNKSIYWINMKNVINISNSKPYITFGFDDGTSVRVSCKTYGNTPTFTNPNYWFIENDTSLVISDNILGIRTINYSSGYLAVMAARELFAQESTALYKFSITIPDVNGRCYYINVANINTYDLISPTILRLDFGGDPNNIFASIHIEMDTDWADRHYAYFLEVYNSYHFLSTFSGTIIDVGPGETHTTITSAMTAASLGDAIKVQSGTYSEAIRIKDGITVYFENDANTIGQYVGGAVDAVTCFYTTTADTNVTFKVLGFGNFTSPNHIWIDVNSPAAQTNYFFLHCNDLKSDDYRAIFGQYTSTKLLFKGRNFSSYLTGSQTSFLDTDAQIEADFDFVKIFDRDELSFQPYPKAAVNRHRVIFRNAHVKSNNVLKGSIYGGGCWDDPNPSLKSTDYLYVNILMDGRHITTVLSQGYWIGTISQDTGLIIAPDTFELIQCVVLGREGSNLSVFLTDPAENLSVKFTGKSYFSWVEASSTWEHTDQFVFTNKSNAIVSQYTFIDNQTPLNGRPSNHFDDQVAYAEFIYNCNHLAEYFSGKRILNVNPSYSDSPGFDQFETYTSALADASSGDVIKMENTTFNYTDFRFTFKDGVDIWFDGSIVNTNNGTGSSTPLFQEEFYQDAQSNRINVLHGCKTRCNVFGEWTWNHVDTTVNRQRALINVCGKHSRINIQMKKFKAEDQNDCLWVHQFGGKILLKMTDFDTYGYRLTDGDNYVEESTYDIDVARAWKTGFGGSMQCTWNGPTTHYFYRNTYLRTGNVPGAGCPELTHMKGAHSISECINAKFSVNDGQYIMSLDKSPASCSLWRCLFDNGDNLNPIFEELFIDPQLISNMIQSYTNGSTTGINQNEPNILYTGTLDFDYIMSWISSGPIYITEYSETDPPKSIIRHRVSSPLRRLIKNINKKGPST